MTWLFKNENIRENPLRYTWRLYYGTTNNLSIRKAVSELRDICYVNLSQMCNKQNHKELSPTISREPALSFRNGDISSWLIARE